MKIYTKTGDKGMTGLISGKRVSKASSFVEAYGSVDELNSWIGYCRAARSGNLKEALDNKLSQIQSDLHIIGSDLAAPFPTPRLKKFLRISPEAASELEVMIDQIDRELSPLTRFILPGGSELAARFHITRTVCRRAERQVVLHSKKSKTNPEVVIYLNRLSDLLFMLARWANLKQSVADVTWDSKKSH